MSYGQWLDWTLGNFTPQSWTWPFSSFFVMHCIYQYRWEGGVAKAKMLISRIDIIGVAKQQCKCILLWDVVINKSQLWVWVIGWALLSFTVPEPSGLHVSRGPSVMSIWNWIQIRISHCPILNPDWCSTPGWHIGLPIDRYFSIYRLSYRQKSGPIKYQLWVIGIGQISAKFNRCSIPGSTTHTFWLQNFLLTNLPQVPNSSALPPGIQFLRSYNCTLRKNSSVRIY